MSLIRFDNVSKIYDDNFVALSGVNLEIGEGEFVSIVGASGAGKSTFLKLIYAEELPTEGMMFFGERSTGDIKQRLLPYYRRNFGTVFQDFKLLPNKTVFENVAFALEVDGRTNQEIHETVPKILSVVNLEKKRNQYPAQLSGGEKQRVSMARALVIEPKVFIADEPTGNLDPKSTQDILGLLKKIHELGTTIILATHEKDIVDAVKQRVVTFEDGRVMSDDLNGKYTL